MSTLYLVATPIGNLDDISLRALRVLKEVHLITAEDTRRTRKLLTHYKIKTPLTSYFDHNKHYKTVRILDALDVGDVALVSDSGTPLINDPGYELVNSALDNGHTIRSIPGPSAPIAALVASGLPSDAFLYLGYLPRKTGDRCAVLQDVSDLPYTLVFFEAPHRLISALEDLLDVFGNRRISIARELTKLHEEIFRGSVKEALKYFSTQPPRGEFTLVVKGKEKSENVWAKERLLSTIDQYKDSGLSQSKIAQQIARESGWPRREIYALLTQSNNEEEISDPI